MHTPVRRRASFSLASLGRLALCAGLSVGVAVGLCGCTTWSRPAAELSQFRNQLDQTPPTISAAMLSPTGCGDSRGNGEFTVPARIAVARVQTTPGPIEDYEYRAQQYERANMTGPVPPTPLVLTVPTDDALYSLLSAVKHDTGVAAVSVLAGTTQRFGHSADSIMSVARGMNADWLMLYTMDTKLTDEIHGLGLAILTLGLIPNHIVSHDATALAMVVDLKTNKVVAEWTIRDDGWQPANGYTTSDARKQVEGRTESRVERRLARQLGELRHAVAPLSGDRSSHTSSGTGMGD